MERLSDKGSLQESETGCTTASPIVEAEAKTQNEDACYPIFGKRKTEAKEVAPETINVAKKLKTRSRSNCYCLACGKKICRFSAHDINRHINFYHKNDKNYKSSNNIIEYECKRAENDRKKRGIIDGCATIKPIASSSINAKPSSMHCTDHISMESTDLSSINSRDPSIESTVPYSSKSTVPYSSKSTVPSSIDSTVPSSIDSTVPCSIDSTVPSSIDSTVPSSIDSTVPSSIDSTVPSSIKATVPSSIKATVISSSKSTVPSSIKATVISSSKSTVPSSTVSPSMEDDISIISGVTDLENVVVPSVMESTINSSSKSTVPSSIKFTVPSYMEDDISIISGAADSENVIVPSTTVKSTVISSSKSTASSSTVNASIEDDISIISGVTDLENEVVPSFMESTIINSSSKSTVPSYVEDDISIISGAADSENVIVPSTTVKSTVTSSSKSTVISSSKSTVISSSKSTVPSSMESIEICESNVLRKTVQPLLNNYFVEKNSSTISGVTESENGIDFNEDPFKQFMVKQMSQLTNRVDFLCDKVKLNKNIPATSKEAVMENIDFLNVNKCPSLISLLEIIPSLKLFEQSEGAVLRCLICYQAKYASPLDLLSNNLELLHAESKKDRDSFISGIPLSAEKLHYLNSSEERTKKESDMWYSFKHKIKQHFSCSDTGKQHLKSIECLNLKKSSGNRVLLTTSYLINAALTLTTIKSAALNFETLLSAFQFCGVDIGEIGHGRKQYGECLKACVAYIRRKLSMYMTTKLPSTGLCPHFGTTCDKSTLNRSSNHGMMILIQYEGERKAIPFGAPCVYTQKDGSVTGGSSEDMANQLFDTFHNYTDLPYSHLSYHMANHSDGQYQTKGFISALRTRNGSILNKIQEKYYVIPWDNSHWLDLSVKDLQKPSCMAADVLKSFIARVNRAATIFHRGKGRDEYMAFCKDNGIKSYEVSSYSTTRFFSSNYHSFLHMYSSYAGIIGAYVQNREIPDSCETTKYELRGRDFAIQLCGIIDIFKAFNELMIKAQDLNQQLWKIVTWTPKVIEILRNIESHLAVSTLDSISEEVLPCLAKHKGEILADKFLGRNLLTGWLIESEKSKKVNWVAKNDTETLEDLKILCGELIKALTVRYEKSVSPAAHDLHKCFEVSDIVGLCAGYRDQAGSPPILDDPEKFIDYGSETFKEFFEYVMTLPHVMQLKVKAPNNIELYAGSALKVYSKFKDLIHDVIWSREYNGLLKIWFPELESLNLIEVTSLKVIKQKWKLENSYIFSFCDGTSSTSKLDEQKLFQSFYQDESVYKRAGQALCIVLDVALAKGGCEAVVESFYSVMGNHEKHGGQSNDHLVDRTIVDWCLPNPLAMKSTVQEIAKIYLNGDMHLNVNKHTLPFHHDLRGRSQYQKVGKVMQRLANKVPKLPMLVEDNDLAN